MGPTPDEPRAIGRPRLHHPLAIVGISLAWLAFLLGVGEVSNVIWGDPPPRAGRRQLVQATSASAIRDPGDFPIADDPLAAFHQSPSMARYRPGFEIDGSLIRLGRDGPTLTEAEAQQVLARMAKAAPDLMRTDWSRSAVVREWKSEGKVVQVVRVAFPMEGPFPVGPEWRDWALVYGRVAHPMNLDDVIDLADGRSLADVAAAVALGLPDWASAWEGLGDPRPRAAARAADQLAAGGLGVVADRVRTRHGVGPPGAALARLAAALPDDPWAASALLRADPLDGYDEYVPRFGPPLNPPGELTKRLVARSLADAVSRTADALRHRPERTDLLDELRRALPAQDKWRWRAEWESALLAGGRWPRVAEDALIRDRDPADLRELEALATKLPPADANRLRLRGLAAAGRWADLAALDPKLRSGFDGTGAAGTALASDLFARGELPARLDLFPRSDWPAVVRAAYESGRRDEAGRARLAELVGAARTGPLRHDPRLVCYVALLEESAGRHAEAAAMFKSIRAVKLDPGMPSPEQSFVRALTLAGEPAEAYRVAADKADAFGTVWRYAPKPADRLALVEARLPDAAGPEKAFLTGIRHVLRGERREAVAALRPLSLLAGPDPEPAGWRYSVAEALFNLFAALGEWRDYDALAEAIRRREASPEGSTYPSSADATARGLASRRRVADLLGFLSPDADEAGEDLWSRPELRDLLRSPEFAPFRAKYPEPKGNP